MGGFELLIQLESLKPWPETSTLMRRVEFHKSNFQTGSFIWLEGTGVEKSEDNLLVR